MLHSKFIGRVMLASLLVWFTSAAAQGRDLVLAVSEGTSGGTDHARVIAKYGPLAQYLSKAGKQKVVVVFAREFSQLEEGMKTGRYDLVMARPSDYPARGMRDYGYRYMAHAKPDGQCWLLVRNASPVQTLAQAKGKRWVFPESAAYMSKFCRAELRDQGIDLDKEKVTYVREQALIAPYLDTAFADVGGVASYSGVAKGADKNGHRVLHKSRAQPYFPMVAGKRVSDTQLQAMQRALAELPAQSGGKEILTQIGIQGFAVDGEDALSKLLTWLEKR